MGPRTALSLKVNDRADRLFVLHQVEGVVDVLQDHGAGHQWRQFDLAAYGLCDNASGVWSVWSVGEILYMAPSPNPYRCRFAPLCLQ
ncbi:hypothetical protein D3C76_1352230 [compost metagenome]